MLITLINGYSTQKKMSQGNEFEREGLHPQSLTETINPEIVENAQTIESQQEGLRPQSPTDTIHAKIHEDAEKTKSLFSSACIYRVRRELRKLNESAYTPRLIAIGPLHRNDEHLKSTPMQYVKGSYTNSLFLRLTEGERYRVLEDCVAEMKRSIDDAEKCYAEEVTLDEQMLLLDGCFIIELFYRAYLVRKGFRTDHVLPPGVEKKADPIYKGISTAKDVQMDLLLIENQIPFFVLDKLFRLIFPNIDIPNHPNKITLRELAGAFFRNKILIGSNENSTADGSVKKTNGGSSSQHAVEMSDIQSSGNYEHILHKVHCDCLRDHKKEKGHFSEYARAPSASDLDYAGVKFVAGNEKDPFKFKFNNPEGPFWWSRRASFEIPPLKIYDSTEILLRNLIAFEQCCRGVPQHISSYAFLMGVLVNTKEDVDKLEKAKVIHNYLGSSEDATKLFNKLCKEIVIGDFFFGDQFKNATKYSERFWPKNMIHLRRTYFASPWTFIAFCVGFIAFFMSIAGSIHSLLEKR